MAKAREVPGLHARLPFREAAVATIRVRTEELFDAQEDVLDTEDIERVHRMRVATRRLRAVMEIYRPCFEQATFKPVLRDVKALADALGARRDPDVQLEALESLAAALPKIDLVGVDLLADEVRGEQQAGNELLAVALAETERSDLRGRLLGLLDELEAEADDARQADADADADDPQQGADDELLGDLDAPVPAPAELADTPSGEQRLEEAGS